MTKTPEIIYVHLGPSPPPDYLHDSIKQVRLFNPHSKITILHQCTTDQALTTTKICITDDLVNHIACQNIEKTQIHKNFEVKYPKICRHRDRYWRYAIERLYYLHDYLVQMDATQVFHLENDILLYRDLTELMPVLQKIEARLALTEVNKSHMSFGLVYIDIASSLGAILEYFNQNLSGKTNDMKLAAMFLNQRCQAGPGLITTLPILPIINGENACGTENFEHFQSVFDGASWGQYVGGTDRAHLGIGWFTTTHYIGKALSTGKYSIRWQEDSLGRSIPYCCVDDTKYLVNNLHIHSKQLKLYRS